MFIWPPYLKVLMGVMSVGAMIVAVVTYNQGDTITAIWWLAWAILMDRN